MAVEPGHPAYAGQAMYTRRFLRVYDAVIHGFNSPILWRCPKARLIDLYDKHASARHLDIGVGTGVKDHRDSSELLMKIPHLVV